MILCRLFGRKIPTHFLAEWVSIMHEVVEGFTFNWDKILSDNLTKEIAEYQMENSKGQPASFYMSAYVMDAICYMTPFPLINWSWNSTCAKPIHFYHSKLWEEKVKDFFYEICHYVVRRVQLEICALHHKRFPLSHHKCCPISVIRYREFWMKNH